MTLKAAAARLADAGDWRDMARLLVAIETDLHRLGGEDGDRLGGEDGETSDARAAIAILQDALDGAQRTACDVLAPPVHCEVCGARRASWARPVGK